MQNIILMSVVSEASGSLNVWGLIEQAGWVVKAVMIILVVASVACWTIILGKWMTLRAARAANQKFADSFWQAGSLETAQVAAKANREAPMTRVFETGLQEYNQVVGLKKLDRTELNELLETNVGRSLEKAISNEGHALQKHLQVLATTASAGPFIGLFGTVWGIMTSFINIGATGASNLAVVAPGIAEALIATAIGLFAAIPAAVFYNVFMARIKEMSGAMRSFSADFLNTARRSL